ncbi:methylated-DNA--protein-cysteine methyltransferase-like [Crassostrea virginica]|uniref:Methylated-DNA--protein-cysteine methyltransferase n=1 Tax=Crassostrea virginica TaxID=6565 RepID=A0A8B8CTN7_CRAVI|nr:methylated-DNA--protein-cysteine methyltransferase-like [Crassostrea virginica]XP_022314323.1 methylated-DNA--protein-cysteine methyltransferase-like [Crassostrea virginica]XP_022317796.1 methylated-DNA--protein-cysteine methyltransferase-like [Crassostrea virginica]XP_022317797.1 methylated-DNA--protein-cysteine methyltransferase-like [Crassostrea virginica]
MKGRKLVCQSGPTNTYVVSTPIGDMEIVSCPRGLHSLQQMAPNDQDFTPSPGTKVAVKSQLYQDNGYTYKPAVLCVQWLQHYFAADKSNLHSSPPVCASVYQLGTFTETVWRTLQSKVTFGQVISYGSLASLCGSARACRAVGLAMRNNPISLIMPCHRVIQSGGKVGNYSGGQKNKIKVWLLEHEGAEV